MTSSTGGGVDIKCSKKKRNIFNIKWETDLCRISI